MASYLKENTVIVLEYLVTGKTVDAITNLVSRLNKIFLDFFNKPIDMLH
jgi:hypothetical protein